MLKNKSLKTSSCSLKKKNSKYTTQDLTEFKPSLIKNAFTKFVTRKKNIHLNSFSFDETSTALNS